MYTPEQEKRSRKNSQKLLQVFDNKKIIMNDKSYFKLKCDYLPGNDHFFTSYILTTPNDIKFITQKKFPVQLMVWICVSEDAISEPVFLERPNSTNGEFYREYCIKGKLIKFIEKYHSKDNFIFLVRPCLCIL